VKNKSREPEAKRRKWGAEHERKRDNFLWAYYLFFVSFHVIDLFLSTPLHITSRLWNNEAASLPSRETVDQ
jgi:hypothetical protein